MQEVGWQEGVIQSVANFMFQNRRQVLGRARSNKHWIQQKKVDLAAEKQHGDLFSLVLNDARKCRLAV